MCVGNVHSTHNSTMSMVLSWYRRDFIGSHHTQTVPTNQPASQPSNRPNKPLSVFVSPSLAPTLSFSHSFNVCVCACMYSWFSHPFAPLPYVIRLLVCFCLHSSVCLSSMSHILKPPFYWPAWNYIYIRVYWNYQQRKKPYAIDYFKLIFVIDVEWQARRSATNFKGDIFFHIWKITQWNFFTKNCFSTLANKLLFSYFLKQINLVNLEQFKIIIIKQKKIIQILTIDYSLPQRTRHTYTCVHWKAA